MRKSLGLLLAALLLGSVLALQPASADPTAPVPSATVTGGSRQTTGTLWGNSTLISFYGGKPCWKITVKYGVIRGNNNLVARPGFTLDKWCGWAGDVTSGTLWHCSDDPQIGAGDWHIFSGGVDGCTESFTAYGNPTRTVYVDYDYIDYYGFYKNADLQMTFDYQGNVAYQWWVDW